MKNQTKAYILALLAVLFWSTVASAFKIALSTINYKQLLLLSSLFSVVILFLILIQMGKINYLKKLKLKDYLRYALFGFLNPFLYYLVLFKAYELLPAQEALSLNYTWAVVVVIFSIIFLKQRIKIWSIFSLIISFLGVIIIATHGRITDLSFKSPFGVILAVGSSLIWAGFWILNIKDKKDEVVKLFLSFTSGFILIFIYNVNSLGSLFQISLKGYLASGYIGAFEMGFTFVLWLNALKLSENTAKVSSLVYLSPFISLILINFILGEKILLSTIAGVCLIIFGIILQKTIK